MTPQLSGGSEGRYALSGPITFATARRVYDEGVRRFGAASGNALAVDCAGVSAADSAGLAVLIGWLAWSRRAGRTLRYSALPASVLAIARISEAEGLLRG
ncbi:MAG TPA: STAS domain-containing protein [Steroidobacteraceae bacterium]|nr:STAS domain-containing protein [Steroidobacteraceae bacterium]